MKEIDKMVREEFEENQHRRKDVKCNGLEESSTLNVELKKREGENTVI